MEQTSPSILIVDLDSKFLESVNKDPKAIIMKPMTLTGVRDAQLALANSDLHFSAVILNPKVDDQNEVTIIRHSRMYRPATPIYILHEGEKPFTDADQKLLGIDGFLKKPINYSEIIDTITPHMSSIRFDSNKELAGVISGQEFTANDAGFIPIRAADFMSGTKSLFDLFVKLNSGKYIKILQANENMDQNRVASYLSKGVTHFYLEAAAQAKYLAYCDKLASVLIANKAVPKEVKVKSALTQGEETLNLLKSQGVSMEALHYAGGFVKNVELLTRSEGLHKNQLVNSFLNDLNKYEHAVAISMVSCILARSIGFTGARAVKIVGLASLLHDIGLVGVTEECEESCPESLQGKQLENFNNHPIVGSKALMEMNVDPGAVQAVAQHHERRTRKGFPHQLGAGSINKVAEVVGISEEFLKLSKNPKKDPKFNLANEMTKNVFQHFSWDIVEAFRTLIIPSH